MREKTKIAAEDHGLSLTAPKVIVRTKLNNRHVPTGVKEGKQPAEFVVDQVIDNKADVQRTFNRVRRYGYGSSDDIWEPGERFQQQFIALYEQRSRKRRPESEPAIKKAQRSPSPQAT